MFILFLEWQITRFVVCVINVYVYIVWVIINYIFYQGCFIGGLIELNIMIVVVLKVLVIVICNMFFVGFNDNQLSSLKNRHSVSFRRSYYYCKGN